MCSIKYFRIIKVLLDCKFRYCFPTSSSSTISKPQFREILSHLTFLTYIYKLVPRVSSHTSLGRTFTRGATLVEPHDWVRAAGHRARYEHTHLPPGVAVAVAAAVVPAVAFLVAVAVRSEAVAGQRRQDGGAGNVLAFCRHRRAGV